MSSLTVLEAHVDLRVQRWWIDLVSYQRLTPSLGSDKQQQACASGTHPVLVRWLAIPAKELNDSVTCTTVIHQSVMLAYQKAQLKSLVVSQSALTG
jgi:hypothetical protein